jgi:hypothetical protein
MHQPSTKLRVLVDGTVIVASILLAFGIDRWWDAWQEARAEQDYVERISADLSETRVNIEQNGEHYRTLLRHADATLPIFAGRARVPDDTLGFLASALQASRITSPVIARSAYDDLISTGNLRLIQRDTVRYALSRFYANVAVQLDPVDYSSDQEPYRTVIRSVIPVDLQLFIREHCLQSEPLSCESSAPPPGVGPAARALLRERGLQRTLTLSMQAKAVRIGFVLDRAGFSGGFGVVTQEIDELLALLGSEYAIR